MLPRTTPLNTFTLPPSLHTRDIEKVEVVYAQNDVVVFEKDTSECTMSDNEISVRLTQENTLKLDHRLNVQIQLWVKTKGGDVLGSDIIVTDVEQCLKNEVM